MIMIIRTLIWRGSETQPLRMMKKDPFCGFEKKAFLSKGDRIEVYNDVCIQILIDFES